MSQFMAQQADELKARKVELVLQQLDSLPTLPAIVVRLLALTGNTESNVREVVELISADPSLTSKVLSLVGSSAMAGRIAVTTVQQAVVRLGFETIRNLVLSVKVFEVFQQEQANRDAIGFDRTEFWKHSLAVATVAEMLAPKVQHRVSPQDAFVCGLLHDLGKIAFDTVMPKSFDRAVEVASLTRGDIADAERRIIGLDHAVAGKRLAEAWNLPTLLTQVVWLHGSAPMSVPHGISNPAMVQLVGLADMVVRRQHIGFSGNFAFPFEVSQYLQPLGVSQSDLESVTQQLNEQLELRAKALGLYQVQSRQLYLESIANANNELGRVNQALAIQNRKLAVRSQCFELLTRFYQRIVPAASPAQLLAEMGHVANGPFGAARMVLFSQDPDQQVGEVLNFDAGAKIQDSFLMQMPRAGGDQRVGRNTANSGPGSSSSDPIRPASPQLDWLLERVKEFLGAERCWFLPLMCGIEPVGGLVWAGSENAPALAGVADLAMVSQSWGMTLRMSQVREQQNVLTEALAASNRELASLQQQLVRAKSLASLGEMAAGAAHEMNNPLAVVCGRAQLLASKMADAGLKQDATLIAQQGERLSQIITDLMEFARPGSPKLAGISLPAVVKEAADAASTRAALPGKPTPKVHINAAGDLPNVQGDAGQLKNAIGEVIVNAIQAAQVSPEANEAGVRVQLKYDTLDHRAIIQVTDQGTGMSDDVARQAFAPFFSAKTAGRQRGMGLAKALRWVEMHGGTIRLDSSPGAGTTAVIILPENGGASENRAGNSPRNLVGRESPAGTQAPLASSR